MLDDQTRHNILSRGKPEPKDFPWWGEPNLGGWYTEAEVEAAVSAIRDSMDWTTGFGPDAKVIAEFEEVFAEYCGAQFAIAINSCGTGLDLAMRCLNLKPGDEVISPAVNYKAAHMAILDQGGKVVFCDIDPRTLNLDPVDVEKRITLRTRAILPVHMNGLSAPMDELLDIAKRNAHPVYGALKVIGDAARSCGASYKGTKVGAKGWMNVFSFQTQKLMTTLGEGGMITTNDKKLGDRLRNMRQFGGEQQWGSNYKMSKVQAAVGLVQLRRLDEMNAKRKEAAKRRNELLSGVSEIILPYEPRDCEHVYYVYSILVKHEWAGEGRDSIISVMNDNFGIVCSISNPPTYSRWSYILRNCQTQPLAVSDDIGKRLFCPPLHPSFNEEQELYICARLLEAIEITKNKMAC